MLAFHRGRPTQDQNRQRQRAATAMSDLSTSSPAIVGSILADPLYWSAVLFISRSRLSFSPLILASPEPPRLPTNTRVTRLPWSAQNAHFWANLATRQKGELRYERLSIRSMYQPMLGGRLRPSQHRRLCGRIGASHRLTTISAAGGGKRLKLGIGAKVRCGRDGIGWRNRRRFARDISASHQGVSCRGSCRRIVRTRSICRTTSSISWRI
jgi:hypothetical protein